MGRGSINKLSTQIKKESSCKGSSQNQKPAIGF